ncbi:MAG: type I secretion C-terminal target domain-containing protein [Pseudomonadota bacterium]
MTATVVAMVGRVFARQGDEGLRELKLGDVLYEGETIVTGQNARVELSFDFALGALALADGVDAVQGLTIGSNDVVRLDSELIASLDPATATREIQDALFNQEQSLLAQSFRIEGLDENFEEPAAGLSESNLSSAPSFVRLDKVDELFDLDALTRQRLDLAVTAEPRSGVSAVAAVAALANASEKSAIESSAFEAQLEARVHAQRASSQEASAEDAALANAHVVSGGVGSDTLSASIGADVFRWTLSDRGTVALPSVDVITDFDLRGLAAGGDALDLRDLLQGEQHSGTDAGSLASYLHFERSGQDTLVQISTLGNGQVDQIIDLRNVDLLASFSNDTQIIQELLKQNKLIVD